MAGGLKTKLCAPRDSSAFWQSYPYNARPEFRKKPSGLSRHTHFAFSKTSRDAQIQSVISQPPPARCITNDLRASSYAELFSSTRLVRLNRLHAQVKAMADFLAGKPQRNQLEHLGLALCQIRSNSIFPADTI